LVKPFLRAFREGAKQELPLELSAAVAQIAGGAGDGESVVELVTLAARPSGADNAATADQNCAAVAALLDSLEGTGASLSKLSAGNAKTADALRKLEPLFAAARKLADDASTADDKRAAAIRLLYRGPSRPDDDLVTLIALTGPKSAPAVRSAAVESLGRIGTPASIDPLIKGWRSYGPGDRALVLDALLNRREGTQALLTALSSGAIAPRDVDLERRQRLLRSGTRSVRERAEKIFASEVVNKDRQKVIDTFVPALSLTGDAGKGKPAYDKLCASCHKLGDVGHAVGPDLAGLTDPSPTYLLTHILDPNRAVEARYANYVVETSRGQTYSGILAGEAGDSVTILQANGLAQTVARSDLKLMRSTGLSLMPEGLETGLSPQDLADLMAFVASKAPPPTRKLFKGNEPQLVKAAGNGVIRLTPQTAEIYGPRIQLEEQYGNLGWWENPSDRATWQVEATKAGKYTVWLDFACDDNSAGNTLAIEDGASRLTVKVPSTGGWDTYRKQQVGEINLRPGKQSVTLKPEGKPDGALIDLKAVEFVPE
jgi:putative heme-binding domain-containing protein